MMSRISTRIAFASALVASLGFTGSAFAASKSGTLNVQLTIEEGCSVFDTDGANLNFGTWSGLTDNIKQSATFNVSCSGKDQKFSVGLDAGKGAGASVAARYMTNSADATKKVGYNLYTGPDYQKVWGTGADAASYTAATTAAQTNVPFTVYGWVKPQINPGSGVYKDTVAILVTLN
jgi:spore coat protein U-like protein